MESNDGLYIAMWGNGCCLEHSCDGEKAFKTLDEAKQFLESLKSKNMNEQKGKKIWVTLLGIKKVDIVSGEIEMIFLEEPDKYLYEYEDFDPIEWIVVYSKIESIENETKN